MMHPFATLTLVVSALALPSALVQQSGAARQTDARTETVYVSVLDRDGKPVTGIPASDFIVREDGAIREVLKAGPATEPLTISLLVDDSQASEPAIQQIRDGLTAFVDRLQGHAEIALATVGERPTPVVDYTANAAELKKAIGRIFARPGSGSYLLDALVDVSRGLQKREAKRPTIVVLTIEAVEFSNRHYEPVLEELKKSGAALHVLAVGTPTNARSFSFSVNFMSSEYPEWTCSPFNDFFVVLLDSTYTGSPANPTDKNLAFYTSPSMQIYPVGVNLAAGNTGLFTVCTNGPTGCMQ